MLERNSMQDIGRFLANRYIFDSRFIAYNLELCPSGYGASFRSSCPFASIERFASSNLAGFIVVNRLILILLPIAFLLTWCENRKGYFGCLSGSLLSVCLVICPTFLVLSTKLSFLGSSRRSTAILTFGNTSAHQFPYHGIVLLPNLLQNVKARR